MMNCKEFSDIADSYLGNELMIETNHGVLRHLESCRNCRELLTIRRQIRERLSSAVKRDKELAINAAFALRLKERLRKAALNPRFAFSGFRMALAASAAAILIALGVFLPLVKQKGERVTGVVNPPISFPSNTFPDEVRAMPAVLVEAAGDAIDDHKNCALSHKLTQKPISLEEAARTVDIVNAEFDRVVIEPIEKRFGDHVRFVKAHYCLINGRYFTHVVLEIDGSAVSVLLTQLNAGESSETSAVCREIDGLIATCDASNGYGLFVVSESAERSLSLAKMLAGTVRDHIAKGRTAI